MINVPGIFGEMVFNEATMKERLPEDIYDAMKTAIRDGKRLDSKLADAVATAMKDWAVEKGATHYTHWFQPMTGVTAEKHDGFITPDGEGGVIMDFSGKELVRGEPDASSLPSGGLRATFEARGYTTWDPTSYAFIKDDTLCIPTAFCSYGGEALDKKTPLLRSMEAVSKQAIRVLRLFGNDKSSSVKTTVGAEQEYFLIDKAMYDRREDLKFTGRTLFGAKPPKGQELDDHYFGTIPVRVDEYMKALDKELWRLGVTSKTCHNETAPAQYELAPVFATANVATDHNQLTMEIMKKTAAKLGLVCLLHEKPFAGVNGSGKHNNWSICTNDGINLLEPGDTPHQNAQFLLFLCAVIKAVDDYQELLRISVASAGNDHRLGAHEAPPAVVSMFLGDELSAILDSVENETDYDVREKVQLKVGVHVLPRFPKDTTDRNRTSPFAFTGNKFEFRMPGSSLSVAGPNIVLNTAVAEVLRQFADELEGKEDFNSALHELIRRVIKDHKRIIFNGNGYDDAWIKEATEVRGLSELKSTPVALAHYVNEKHINLFQTHRVLSETELRSRYEIMLDNYCKVIRIEALTMLDMAKKDIMPAVSRYTKRLGDSMEMKVRNTVHSVYEDQTFKRLCGLLDAMLLHTAALEKALGGVLAVEDKQAAAEYYEQSVIAVMNSLRLVVDEAETLTERSAWPYPAYSDLLYCLE